MSALPDGASEEAVMEWFTDEVANGEANNDAGGGTSEEKVRLEGILRPCPLFEELMVERFSQRQHVGCHAFCALAGLVRMGDGSENGTSRSYWWQWVEVASKGRSPRKKRYCI